MPFPEFFVGWERTPKSYLHVLRPFVFFILCLVCLLAFVISSSQDPPGAGQWDDSAIVTLQGVADVSPYAIIRIESNHSPSGIRTVFLVESGKFGAVDRLQPFQGQAVQVRGTVLHRYERWMLELDDANDAIQPVPMDAVLMKRLQRPKSISMGQVTLPGEIIDSKCYLGGMKPGGGKTHKACAALCLRGGIPPMFVTRGENKRETYYLAVSPSGGLIDPSIIDYVGDAVEVDAQFEKQGDLFRLKLTADHIRRR
jgi:hypothetical protein